VRIARRDVVFGEGAQERLLEDADACGHVPRGAVGVVLDLTPLGILAVENALEPHGQRGHAHLDEVAGVIDCLREGRGEYNQPPIDFLSCPCVLVHLGVCGRTSCGVKSMATLYRPRSGCPTIPPMLKPRRALGASRLSTTTDACWNAAPLAN